MIKYLLAALLVFPFAANANCKHADDLCALVKMSGKLAYYPPSTPDEVQRKKEASKPKQKTTPSKPAAPPPANENPKQASEPVMPNEPKLQKASVSQAQVDYIRTVNKRISQSEAARIVRAAHNVGKKYNVSPKLLLAMARKESTYNRKAVSSVGAKGVIQVYPKYHKQRMARLGVRNLQDIKGGMLVGGDVLSEYLNTSPNMRVALRRYSGGARNYYNTVMKYYREIPD